MLFRVPQSVSAGNEAVLAGAMPRVAGSVPAGLGWLKRLSCAGSQCFVEMDEMVEDSDQVR